MKMLSQTVLLAGLSTGIAALATPAMCQAGMASATQLAFTAAVAALTAAAWLVIKHPPAVMDQMPA